MECRTVSMLKTQVQSSYLDVCRPIDWTGHWLLSTKLDQIFSHYSLRVISTDCIFNHPFVRATLGKLCIIISNTSIANSDVFTTTHLKETQWVIATIKAGGEKKSHIRSTNVPFSPCWCTANTPSGTTAQKLWWSSTPQNEQIHVTDTPGVTQRF